MRHLYESLKAFLAEPFTTPFSGWQYAAIVGLTLILVIFWTFVLNEVMRGAKKVTGG